MNQYFPDYLSWHFVVVPAETLKAWLNFLTFNFYFFSTGVLMSTLFSPWRRMVKKKELPGFRPDEFFNILTYNLVSRGIGATIRLFFILLSLVSEVVIFALGLPILAVILFTPILSLPAYFRVVRQKKWFNLINKAGSNPKLFIRAFLNSKRGKFLIKRLNLNLKLVKKEVFSALKENPIETPAPKIQQLKNPSEVFMYFYSVSPQIRHYFDNLEIKETLLKSTLFWFDRLEAEKGRLSRFWERGNLSRTKALATDWVYGYTLNLDKFSNDMTQKQEFESHLVGRDDEVSRIETILSGSVKNNVLILGEEGVGKKTVVYQFANEIREGKVLPFLKHKRVLEVNVNKVLGESASMIDSQNKFEAIIEEAIYARNIILVFPGIDRFLSSGPERVDLSPIFDRKLSGGELQVIGITTDDLYHKYLLPNPVALKLFENISVSPPSKEEAILICEDFVSEFEKTHNILITYQAILAAVEKSDRYITEIPFPEKAIDLLDETAINVVSSGNGIVTAKDIDLVLSVKTKIPIGDITKKETEKLLDLEKVIHRRLIDQNEAVVKLADAFRRTRLGVGRRKKPAGVFLFLGPTGTGKTETAKALAEAYFGREENLIRLDMSEFQDPDAGTRLLGDFRSQEPGIMVKLLRNNPFSVFLLDEIEKASPQVLNLFLSAFDEGYITDNFGKKVSLLEMIIISTSNAGSEYIRQKIEQGENVDSITKSLIDHLLREGVFSPEFLNRFDSVIVFKPLSEKDLIEIAKLKFADLNKRLAERKISIKITDKLLSRIVSLGYEPTFGARPMNRVIQDRIEAPLAKMILEGKVVRGQEVDFDTII